MKQRKTTEKKERGERMNVRKERKREMEVMNGWRTVIRGQGRCYGVVLYVVVGDWRRLVVYEAWRSKNELKRRGKKGTERTGEERVDGRKG